MSKKNAPSLAVIITAHKEGSLLLPTIKSAQIAIENLKINFDVEVEMFLFLDKSDSLTQEIAEELISIYDLSILKGHNGDPGQARLEAIGKTESELIALLDGDDLWSADWLFECYKMMEKSGFNHLQEKIYHPEYNLIFGAHECLVRQGNPEDSFFKPSFLRIGNYWDALCLTHRKVFDKFKYIKNDLDNGYAHEDYVWACETFCSGLKHILVKDTVHFKRRRSGSVSVIAEAKRVKPRMTKINSY